MPNENNDQIRPELNDLTSNVEAYFDRFMADPNWGNLSGGDATRVEHGKVFSGVVAQHFDLDLLAQERVTGQEYNPILIELGSIMASIDHNAGIYYSSDEVDQLFEVMANHILDDDSLKDKLQQATVAGSTAEMDKAFKDRITGLVSLDREQSLAVVNSETGWRVADGREYDGLQDFSPLEIIRQDNPDKSGWNKYRFRQADYTRQQDELHSQQVADGWFASNWIDQPNYWSGRIRNVLTEVAAEAAGRLQITGTDMIMITEGGVLKGTSTSGTDIDTSCIVIGDLSTSFGNAQKILQDVFIEKKDSLPFHLKKDQNLDPVFCDRSTGQTYNYNPKTGNYWAYSSNRLQEGRYVFNIRTNEKGIGLTGSEGFKTYKKPAGQDPNLPVYVSVDVASGSVHLMTSQEVDAYSKLQASTIVSDSDSPNVDQDWIF